jgi:hypothetical protein
MYTEMVIKKMTKKTEKYRKKKKKKKGDVTLNPGWIF